MLEEVENSRIKLFNKSIKELAETLKHTPENFQIKFRIGISTLGSFLKRLFPGDVIKFIKKGNKILLEFSIIGVKSAIPKKRKTHL